VPVPLAGIRERQRGFNQSRLLARGVAKALDAPCADALRRVRSTQAQARTASRPERRRNVEGAFVARAQEAVAGASVLLVDDVASSCSSLDACARALLAAGAERVAAVTFARED
jgi:predicted amidophosphoribosyltransferase